MLWSIQVSVEFLFKVTCLHWLDLSLLVLQWKSVNPIMSGGNKKVTHT